MRVQSVRDPRMRVLPAVVVLTGALALACGGPSTKVVDRAAFTIALIDGTVDTDQDYAAEGDYDVAWGLTTQALSWHPIEPDETLEDGVDMLWDGMSAIVAADGRVSMPSKPAYTQRTVAGQPAVGFEVKLGGESLLSTTWRCPETGVQVTLNTSGLSSASTTHTASLDSATCKTTPVAFGADAAGFRFVGDTRWQPDPDTVADSQGAQWNRNDELVSLSVFAQSTLVDGNLCETTLRHSLTQMDVIAVTAGSVKVANRPSGCTLTFQGVRKEDGERLDGRLHHDDCGGRGYLSVCFSASGEPIEAACDGIVACP